MTPVAPVLVAVDGSSRGIEVTAAAARLAAERGAGVEVVHVHETDVVGEEAVDRESREMAATVLALRLAQLREAGVPAGGEVVHTYGDREDAVRAVLARVDEVGAQAVVVGRRGQVAARAACRCSRADASCPSVNGGPAPRDSLTSAPRMKGILARGPANEEA